MSRHAPTNWPARILVTVWAAFWTWFSIASGIGEWGEHGGGGFLVHLALPVVLVSVVALAWKRPRPGGIALILVGLGCLLFFQPWPSVAAMLVLPPVLGGIGFVARG